MTLKTAASAEKIVSAAEQDTLQASQVDLGGVGWGQNIFGTSSAVEKLGQRFLAITDTHAQAINGEETPDTSGKKRVDDALELIGKLFISSSLLIFLIWALTVLSTWVVPETMGWQLTMPELQLVSFAVFAIGLTRITAVFLLGRIFDTASIEKKGRLQSIGRGFVKVAFFRPATQLVGPVMLLLFILFCGLQGENYVFQLWDGETTQPTEPANKTSDDQKHDDVTPLDRASYESALGSLAWALPAIGFGLMAQAYTMLQHSLAQVTTNRRRVEALSSLKDSIDLFEDYRAWLESQGTAFTKTVERLKPDTSRQTALTNRIASISAKLSARNDRFKQRFDRHSLANVAFVTLFGLLGDVGNLKPSTQLSSQSHLLNWAAGGTGQETSGKATQHAAKPAPSQTGMPPDETKTATAHGDLGVVGCGFDPLKSDTRPRHADLTLVLSTRNMLDCFVAKFNEQHRQLSTLNLTMGRIEKALSTTDRRITKVVHSIDIDPKEFSVLDDRLNHALEQLKLLEAPHPVGIDGTQVAELIEALRAANAAADKLKGPRTPVFSLSSLDVLATRIAEVATELDKLEDARTPTFDDKNLRDLQARIRVAADQLDGLEDSRSPEFNHDEITELGHSLQFINRQLQRIFSLQFPELDHRELVDLANSLSFIDRQLDRTFEPRKPSFDKGDIEAIKGELAIILATLDALKAPQGIAISNGSNPFPDTCTYVAERRFPNASFDVRVEGDDAYWLIRGDIATEDQQDLKTKDLDHVKYALSRAIDSVKTGDKDPLLYVLGSADSKGDVQFNASLAEKRADAVASSLKDFPAVILSAGEGRWVTGALPQKADDPTQRSAQLWLCDEPLGRLARGVGWAQ